MTGYAEKWEPLELEIDWTAEAPTAIEPISVTIPIAPRAPTIEDVFAFEPRPDALNSLEWVDDLDEEALYRQELPTLAETPLAKRPTLRAAPPPPADSLRGPASLRVTVPSLRHPRASLADSLSPGNSDMSSLSPGSLVPAGFTAPSGYPLTRASQPVRRRAG